MRELLCYARGTTGSWEAICVDLDIAVQGPSREDVMERLSAAVCSYIDDAHKEEPAVAHRLLNRRAPFLTRMQYWLEFQLYLLNRDDGKNGSSVGFGIPCPA